MNRRVFAASAAAIAPLFGAINRALAQASSEATPAPNLDGIHTGAQEFDQYMTQEEGFEVLVAREFQNAAFDGTVTSGSPLAGLVSTGMRFDTTENASNLFRFLDFGYSLNMQYAVGYYSNLDSYAFAESDVRIDIPGDESEGMNMVPELMDSPFGPLELGLCAVRRARFVQFTLGYGRPGSTDATIEIAAALSERWPAVDIREMLVKIDDVPAGMIVSAERDSS